MDPIKLFIRRPIFTSMLLLAVMVFGIFSWPRIGVDLMPDIDIPVISVVTILPGADPETIEKDVTEPLEEVLNTTPGLDKLTSVNVENVSQIAITFELERDVDVAAQDVRDRVQSVLSKLPSNIETPLIQKIDLGAMPILSLALSGPLPPEQLTQFAEDSLKPALQQIAGVGTVDLFGERKREVRITLDPIRLRAHGLTPVDAVGALRAQDIDISSGRTTEASQERIVKLRAEAQSLEELRSMVISSPGGIPVQLGEIADVTLGPAEARSLAHLGTMPAIGLTVTKQSGANTVEVAHGIIDNLDRLRSSLPEGCQLELVSDSSRFIEAAINSVQFDMLLGGILAVVVVLVFLRNWRSTIVSALALPTSVVGTFAAMHALGFTFNIITTLALTLSIGLLIDDAIVVIENIVRHLEEGVPAMKAAAEGTKQIALAVLAVTLSIVAMFLPVAFMQGIMGRFFFQFGVTVVVAVMISYAVSMTLTPVFSSRLLREEGTMDRWIWRLVERVFHAIESVYRRILAVVLKHRALALLGAVAILGLSLLMASRLEFSFTPAMDQAGARIAVEMPAGSRLEDTGRQVADLSATIEKMPGVKSVFTTVGGGVREEVHKGEVRINLVPIHERNFTQQQFQQHLRETLQVLPGTRIAILDADSSGGASTRNTQAIQLEIRGADWDAVVESAQKTVAEMKNNPVFVDIDMTYRAGKPQLDVIIDRDRAASLGIAAASLGQSLRVLLGRDKVGDYRQGGQTSEIKVVLPDEVLSDPLALGAVQVRGPSGLVELRNIANLVDGTSPGQIDHGSQVRQITILADLKGVSLSKGMAALDPIRAAYPPGVDSEFGGMGGELEKAFGAFALAIVMGIVLLYIILAAQFESLIHPLSIMMALPFAVIGALGGLYLAGQDMSIFAMIGMIMLLGLVAKNGILLIEFTNQLRAQGKKTYDALLEAGPVRLRPILMTTVAMIAGMTPVALARGDAAEMRVPMAVAIIGGLISSTFLTLGVVPVVYSLIDSLRERLGALWIRGKKAAKMPTSEPTVAE